MLELKPITEKEFPYIVDWNNGKDENYLFQWAGHQVYKYPLTIEQIKNHNKTDNLQIYIAFCDGEAVGSIELFGIDKEQSSALICRFILCDKAKNKGLGTSILKKLSEIAFNEMKLNK